MNWVSLKLNLYLFKDTIQESERKAVVRIFVTHLPDNFYPEYKIAYKSIRKTTPTKWLIWTGASQKRILQCDKLLNRGSTLVVILEMQMKTKMRYNTQAKEYQKLKYINTLTISIINKNVENL